MKVIISVSNNSFSNTCHVYLPRLTVIGDLSYWEGKKPEDCNVLGETERRMRQWTEGCTEHMPVCRSQGPAVGMCLRGRMGAGVRPVQENHTADPHSTQNTKHLDNSSSPDVAVARHYSSRLSMIQSIKWIFLKCISHHNLYIYIRTWNQNKHFNKVHLPLT